MAKKIVKRKIEGKVVKFSLIKSAVKSDVGTILYFSPRGTERQLCVGDRVEFNICESSGIHKCKDVKKIS